MRWLRENYDKQGYQKGRKIYGRECGNEVLETSNDWSSAAFQALALGRSIHITGLQVLRLDMKVNAW